MAAAEPKRSPRGRTALVGVGNVLRGDDGFGPSVVRRFAATWRCEPPVEIHDAGTPGADLDGLLDGLARLVIVDALQREGRPGELALLRDADLRRRSGRPRTDPHEPGLLDALQRLALLGRAPSRVLLLGVVPQELSAGTELSDPVREAIPGALLVLRLELARFGHAVKPRPDPREPDLWWRRTERPRREEADRA